MYFSWKATLSEVVQLAWALSDSDLDVVAREVALVEPPIQRSDSSELNEYDLIRLLIEGRWRTRSPVQSLPLSGCLRRGPPRTHSTSQRISFYSQKIQS